MTIIPLEHRIDHFTLNTGQKIQLPFELMLVVATNLTVSEVADPAFLRRMGYRLHLDKPSEASYRIGDGSPVSMDVTAGGAWSVATATWDTSSLEEGYYMITFQTTDSGGTFEREIEVKVSDSEAVPISEVLAHFDTFQGYYVTVEGLVILDIVGPSPTWGVPAGIGVYDISDAAGTRIMAIAAECKSPPLSKLIGNGDFVRIKTVPVRFTMDFLASAGEFQQFMSMIEPYMSFLPEGMMEKDDTAGEVVAVKGLRLMSGTDLVVTS